MIVDSPRPCGVAVGPARGSALLRIPARVVDATGLYLVRATTDRLPGRVRLRWGDEPDRGARMVTGSDGHASAARRLVDDEPFARDERPSMGGRLQRLCRAARRDLTASASG